MDEINHPPHYHLLDGPSALEIIERDGSIEVRHILEIMARKCTAAGWDGAVTYHFVTILKYLLRWPSKHQDGRKDAGKAMKHGGWWLRLISEAEE